MVAVSETHIRRGQSCHLVSSSEPDRDRERGWGVRGSGLSRAPAEIPAESLRPCGRSRAGGGKPDAQLLFPDPFLSGELKRSGARSCFRGESERRRPTARGPEGPSAGQDVVRGAA